VKQPEAFRQELSKLQAEIVACERCPRLIDHCRKTAEIKRRAYRDWDYWGKPVPSLGDPAARLLIIGLAPAAHGANRTGRMFTGDRSGDFLFDALYQTGYASQPTAISADDGLTLKDCYITAPVHCAPPQNKPTPQEFETCRDHLSRELDLLPNVRVVMVLGRLALESYQALRKKRGEVFRKLDYPFGHGKSFNICKTLPTVLCCYHPSQQNTQTGRLTKPMIINVLEKSRDLIQSRQGSRED
jgi:uracil-DNA glycosylase family 4